MQKLLDRELTSEERAVRQAARRSLITIRCPIVRQQQEMTALMQSLQPAVAPPEQPETVPPEPIARRHNRRRPPPTRR